MLLAPGDSGYSSESLRWREPCVDGHWRCSRQREGAGLVLRKRQLMEHKRILRGIVPAQPSRLLYVDHVQERGIDLIRAVCSMGLEGVVNTLAGTP